MAMAETFGTLEYHLYALQNICRICSNRLKTRRHKNTKSERPSKLCRLYRDGILDVYSVDILNDTLDVHPPKICESCYQRILNTKHGFTGVEKAHKLAEGTTQLWSTHVCYTGSVATACKTCVLFRKQREGGAWIRPKRGRPSSCNQNAASLTEENLENVPHMSMSNHDIVDVGLSAIADIESQAAVSDAPETPNVTQLSEENMGEVPHMLMTTQDLTEVSSTTEIKSYC